MEFILGTILLILMIAVGGIRGAKTFAAMYANIIILIVTVFLIACGVNAVAVTIIGCAVIGVVILFWINGVNIKTVTAFAAIATVLLLFAAVMLYIGSSSHIQGFADENTEEICWYSPDIGLDMRQVTLAMMLMGLIGAITDTAIAITSALFEVHENNPELSMSELFISGMNIGRDIIGTTTNTLLFAYIGEFMTLVIWFREYEYSLAEIINSKVFCQDFLQIVSSGAGCMTIIPIAALFMAYSLTHRKPPKDEESEETDDQENTETATVNDTAC
ncbi:MAG: YibE/F family protein [Ruminococcus sp.]|uniref:YibE/F family protein n=1 Tax=Ruminococcus sp. TaxID=41978 RepID=UPI0025F80516|nr:YibE/F family protein [Ruminococcus sp.]MCR5540174.1 YibE/F family protein [Ruminococcus sp.]